MSFQGKTVLVTGGAAGIGAATVLKFAEEGAQVVSVDKDAENGQRIISQVHQRGGSGFFLKADLADKSAIEHCASVVNERIPALHALVNNAGIFVPGSIEDLEPWDLQASVNLLAPVLITRAVLPLMKREGGAIVNISSEGAFRPHPNRWAYDVTKAGIGALTRSMAAEFFPYGIRVNSVAPGWIVTEMHFANAPDPAARKKELEAMEDERICIMRRLGRPEEIANAIVFLASNEASYITATTLHVDGGLVAH